MKKRRILLGLALAAAAVFSLSACDEEAPAEPEVVVTPPAEGDGEEEVSKVDMNGTKYESIKKALEAVPANSTETFTITVEKGTYEENGLAYNGSATVHIKGNTTTKYGADVIIKGHGSDMTTEKTRSLVAIQGTGNIILENLTLQTDWSRTRAAAEGKSSYTQAEVLGTDTKGNTVAYNCSFKSNQDTLRTAGKAWFYGCYVEGDVDFLWMEQAGSVALYEKCEIVSVYDATASSHSSYLTAPRMAVTNRVGKGLVIYNSTVKESAEAKEKNQETYLARTPWSSGYYSQVAYINTDCSDIEASVWKGSPIATEYDKTIIGWKMDQATATKLNYEGNNDILDATTTSNEFGGRKAILNRIYNLGKQKYEKDILNPWDIDALIAANHWTVDNDTSKEILDGEPVEAATVYKFDGSTDVSSLTTSFAQDGTKAQFVGNADATIRIPVQGKCYVTVFGYYQGTLEADSATQGETVMFFNTGNTNGEVDNTYTVYDETTTEVVLTAKAKTYITKIIVEKDPDIAYSPVTSINVTGSTTNYTVGVALNLSAKVNPINATNRSVKWSSSNATVGEVDPYTGKVTFKDAGEVTFTATACDGSGITGSITCEAQQATWTAAEWYTTNDSDLANETGATEIGVFSPASNAEFKSISSTSFKNMSNAQVTTDKALKLNSKGFVDFATTKESTISISILATAKDASVLAVLPPDVYLKADAATKATLVATIGAKDSYTAGDIVTYVYRVPSAGTWTITRGDNNVECSPMLYAKVEYDAVWDFQNASPSEITSVNIQGNNEGTVASNHEGVALTVVSTGGKLQYNSAGYAQFNLNTVIKVPVKNVGSVLTVESFPGQSNYTVGGVNGDTNTDVYTVTAEDVTRGYVEIVAVSTGYIYSITLSLPR